MTVRTYNQDANDHILVTEKQEILARLRRVKADIDRRQRAPR
jgi:hypothetical protein